MKKSPTSSISTLTKDRGFVMLLIAGILTAILWNIPYGDYILYPFTILGTWFHEMGHGLMAILMGGTFEKLEIYSSGSGLATHSHLSLWMGKRLGLSMISLGGLMGPPIVGALFIFAGRKTKSSSIALTILGIVMALSVIIWVRSIYGILVIGIMSVAAVAIAQKGTATLKQFTIQFLGVQAIMSTYRQLDYLFMKEANIGGQTYLSDTGKIAEYLLLPHWFWGALVAAVSAFLLVYSLWRAYR